MLNASIDFALSLNGELAGFFSNKISVEVLVLVQQTAEGCQLAALLAQNIRAKTLVVHEAVVGSLDKAVERRVRYDIERLQ